MSLPYTIIPLVCTVLLILTVIAAIWAKSEKRVNTLIGINRLLSIIILVLAIVQVFVLIKSHPFWPLVRAVYFILTSMLLESFFRRKRETFGSPSLNLTLLVMLVGFAILTFLV
ncbi:MAG TPA: hypothetical protein H9876_00300 [Candidatus Limosilactobacillus merdipullorum]|uniref:DUF1516 family protein n=1 Tax=Candidatus Limosilactobacillus merdipullorum TaxID=2838653 RepID=A0A9D1QM07_9LACO|nr:hypothetical protein [Candidatus Limosilactobacillus merdipullorum]